MFILSCRNSYNVVAHRDGIHEEHDMHGQRSGWGYAGLGCARLVLWQAGGMLPQRGSRRQITTTTLMGLLFWSYSDLGQVFKGELLEIALEEFLHSTNSVSVRAVKDDSIDTVFLTE